MPGSPISPISPISTFRTGSPISPVNPFRGYRTGPPGVHHGMTSEQNPRPARTMSRFIPSIIGAFLPLLLALDVDRNQAPDASPAVALHDAVPVADLEGFRWIPYQPPWPSRHWRC